MPRSKFRPGGVPPKYKIVPAGYDFLGPGNDVNYNVPRNAADVQAKYHDIDYGKAQEEGENPYTEWGPDDDEFLFGLQPNDIPTWVAKGAFKAKQLGGRLGLLHTRGKRTYHLQICYEADETSGRSQGSCR